MILVVEQITGHEAGARPNVNEIDIEHSRDSVHRSRERGILGILGAKSRDDFAERPFVVPLEGFASYAGRPRLRLVPEPGRGPHHVIVMLTTGRDSAAR